MYENPEEEMVSIRDPDNIIKYVGKDTLGELFDLLASDPDLALSMVDSLAAAYVYERKDSYSTDNLGEDRNRSYGSDGDDILVQVTYRVPTYHTDLRAVLRRAEKTVVRNRVEDAAVEAQRRVREAEEQRDALSRQLREAEAELRKVKSEAK